MPQATTWCSRHRRYESGRCLRGRTPLASVVLVQQCKVKLLPRDHEVKLGYEASVSRMEATETVVAPLQELFSQDWQQQPVLDSQPQEVARDILMHDVLTIRLVTQPLRAAV